MQESYRRCPLCLCRCSTARCTIKTINDARTINSAIRRNRACVHAQHGLILLLLLLRLLSITTAITNYRTIIITIPIAITITTIVTNYASRARPDARARGTIGGAPRRTFLLCQRASLR